MHNRSESAQFTAKAEDILLIINFVVKNAESAGVSGKRLMHLELAMEEILVNIVNYAYKTFPGKILVETHIVPQSFRVDVIDNGSYFDLSAIDLPDVGAKLEDRPVGGLGIMLIRNIIDEVHYVRADGRNKTTFVVYTNQ